MLVILDNAQRRQVFRHPSATIAANSADQVPTALEAVTAALAQGRHVAGWLGYELGYALEPRLAPLAAPGPLLRLGVFEAPDDEAPSATSRAYAGPLKPEWDAGDYAARFGRVKDYIAAGDIYQANLSFRARFAFLGEALALYEQLLRQSGAGHCAFVDDGERQILSLSPELFFDLAADSRLTVRPMKGTAPRGTDQEGERAALGASPKDRAENLMIVDLIRNDLSRIAQAGSVEVKDMFKVESYPTLHAMVSTVTAQKRTDQDVTNILRALFPCGSVTGAPKIRAMEILAELEASPRGPYCGAVGCFSPDGSARFNVAIRTLVLKDGQGALGLGGGVVQDSRAPDEYAECLVKARFFETARQPLELVETLRHERGFVRLEAHLARMGASARALGLAFDDAAARTALDQAVAGCTGPLRVRLTLDEAARHRASAQDLPADPPHWTFRLASARSQSGDILLRHKTNWRDLYDQPHPDCDELLFCNERGELTEGARSTLFIKCRDTLLTPPLASGVLPGVLRAELLAQGRAQEAVLTEADLGAEVWFGNSLRGLVRGLKL